MVQHCTSDTDLLFSCTLIHHLHQLNHMSCRLSCSSPCSIDFHTERAIKAASSSFLHPPIKTFLFKAVWLYHNPSWCHWSFIPTNAHSPWLAVHRRRRTPGLRLLQHIHRLILCETGTSTLAKIKESLNVCKTELVNTWLNIRHARVYGLAVSRPIDPQSVTFVVELHHRGARPS